MFTFFLLNHSFLFVLSPTFSLTTSILFLSVLLLCCFHFLYIQLLTIYPSSFSLFSSPYAPKKQTNFERNESLINGTGLCYLFLQSCIFGSEPSDALRANFNWYTCLHILVSVYPDTLPCMTLADQEVVKEKWRKKSGRRRCLWLSWWRHC